MTSKRLKEFELKEAEMALLNASHEIVTEALEEEIHSCTQSNLDLTRERDEQSNQLLELNSQVGEGWDGSYFQCDLLYFMCSIDFL